MIFKQSSHNLSNASVITCIIVPTRTRMRLAVLKDGIKQWDYTKNKSMESTGPRPQPFTQRHFMLYEQLTVVGIKLYFL